MEKIVQLLAAGVLLVACYLHFFGSASHPDVVRLRNTGLTRADARMIAKYIRVYADMVVEDGDRSEPYIPTLTELKLKMRDIGNLTIGTQWKLGDKYPPLPAELAGFFTLDTMDRAMFHREADRLADILEKV